MAAANESYVKHVQQMSAAPAFVEATKSSHREPPHTSGNGPFTATDTLETTGVSPESMGGISNKPKVVALTRYISVFDFWFEKGKTLNFSDFKIMFL